LLGTGVVSALQVAHEDIAMPSDWIKVDRLLRGVAHFWWRQHDEEVSERKDGSGKAPLATPRQSRLGAETELSGVELHSCLLGTEVLHRLMFSSLMLHRHTSAGNTMTLNEWVHLNTGIEAGGADVPMHVQQRVFKAIVEAQKLGGAQLASSPLAQRLDVKTKVASWAYVCYAGRSQAAYGQESAAWPSTSLRALAAEGGVASAGRAGPLPGGAAGLGDDAAAFTEELGYCDFAALPRRRRVSALSALAQPVHKDAPLDECGDDEDIVWASVCSWALFLAHEPGDAPPFAFVWLPHCVLHGADAAKRCLVLRSRPASPQNFQGSGGSDWVDMCLLLGDGRFQPLEAPRLVLRCPTQADYDAWAERLSEACSPAGVQPHGPKVGGARQPMSLDTAWPRDGGQPQSSDGDEPIFESDSDSAAEGGPVSGEARRTPLGDARRV